MIDLHVHSTASDGTLTPEQAVARARELGLEALALADHDTTSGVPPAREAARGTGLLLLPAVEISADYGGQEIHLLGYFVDPAHPELNEVLARMRASREQRARSMVEKLQNHGLPVRWEDVEARAGGESVGRPHVAAALHRAGLVRTLQEAFDRYIGRDRPAYVTRAKPAAGEALRLIRAAGGLTVLAHPGLVGGEARAAEILSLGLEGLEVYHSQHTPTQSRKFLKLAQDRGLLVTGGSDSHGSGGSAPVEIGAVGIPDWEGHLGRLLSWARARGRWED